jgi:Na+/pantothenate symporter
MTKKDFIAYLAGLVFLIFFTIYFQFQYRGVDNFDEIDWRVVLITCIFYIAGMIWLNFYGPFRKRE